MQWIRTYISSSIGKKQIVAVSGMLLVGFLIVHLAGNFLLFSGPDAFNHYAKSLEELGPMLYVLEAVLALLFLTHILFALWVTAENVQARPQKYQVKNWAGRRSLGSSTMPITGLIVLTFLISHLYHFRVAKELEGNAHKTLYDLVVELFQQDLYVAWYVFSCAILGLHLSHGLHSVFKTLGLSNKRYLAVIEVIAIGLAVLIAAGYISIPIYFRFLKGGLS